MRHDQHSRESPWSAAQVLSVSSIRKLPDGRWQAQFRPVPGGRQKTRTAARKADVKRWLDEQTALLVTGSYADPAAGRVIFSAFYREWASRQVWAPTTVRAMDLAAGSVSFGDIQMRLIRRSHIEQWVKGMESLVLAASTIHTRVNNVRSVLRGAVSDRVIALDPSADVRLPRRRRRDAAMTIPSHRQVREILAAADEEFRPFVALCVFAGLRLGEAAAVQLGDVDFLRRRLTVSRQVQRANGGRVDVRPPKYGSERTVHLPDQLVDLLSRHVAANRLSEPGQWLFAGERPGQPPHQNTIGHRWRVTCRRAGVTGIRLHDARHFYASGLIAAGCDVVTVQRALGHASATTTLNTYAHLWPSAEDRTRAAATAMYASVHGADESLTNPESK
jgi:integrase